MSSKRSVISFRFPHFCILLLFSSSQQKRWLQVSHATTISIFSINAEVSHSALCTYELLVLALFQTYSFSICICCSTPLQKTTAIFPHMNSGQGPDSLIWTLSSSACSNVLCLFLAAVQTCSCEEGRPSCCLNDPFSFLSFTPEIRHWPAHW